MNVYHYGNFFNLALRFLLVRCVFSLDIPEFDTCK